MYTIGWDWGGQAHAVTVLDEQGSKAARWTLPHTEVGITGTLRRLSSYGEPGELPVAIETSKGLVVDRLLAAGHPVVAIHPAAFNAMRPRWGASRAKTDNADSFMLADLLRTDGRHPRILAPTHTATLELQALSRQRSDMVATRTSLTNQLRALLEAHWPGATRLFSQIEAQISLAFLEKFPTPQAAARLTTVRLDAFLRRHSYTGRRTGAELLDRIKTAPKAASRLSPETVATLVKVQVGQVRAIVEAIRSLEDAIKQVLNAHPYAELFRALPRVGTVNLAQIIGEIGPMLERGLNADQLAAEVGMAPVTRASGKQHTVGFRHAANRPARKALTHFADNSRHDDPWAADLYRRARDRGKRHPQAVRILGRGWLRVIHACYRDGTPYDPAVHHTRQDTAIAYRLPTQ
ncbi:IS110 family transposase [Streptosporangium sp. NPDC049304]|uniref:IS110 family transposase n=1 Tax=Streptosporangium sp. NPDC049304 TaxID=3154830 RepID=UPI003442C2BF